jgi:hypothetical protein
MSTEPGERADGGRDGYLEGDQGVLRIKARVLGQSLGHDENGVGKGLHSDLRSSLDLRDATTPQDKMREREINVSIHEREYGEPHP